MKENPRDNVGGKLATIGCLQLECLFIEATRNRVLCLSGCVPCIGLFALLLGAPVLIRHDGLMFTASKPLKKARTTKLSINQKNNDDIEEKKNPSTCPFPR